ncbi:MAG: hypothetical protein GX491_12940 [Chloroflexi bacterium]|nr:hypothetical protein [Chloroflexota bacterium]
MERTVPSATSEEIKLYRSTIYSLLRSSAEVQIRTLEELHAGMNSLLHPGARKPSPDISAFIYSTLRLPDCMPDVNLVVLGQNSRVFRRHGYTNLESWQPVSARARRRRCFFDGEGTLACYIASRSDIEDVIPTLTAYQIEWNKMNLLLKRWPEDVDLAAVEEDPEAAQLLADVLGITTDDINRLRVIWRERFVEHLKRIQRTRRSLSVRLLSGPLSQYMRATHNWWQNIEQAFPEISERPVYFVSSNTHSLANILTGFALKHEEHLERFVRQSNDRELIMEWEDILSNHVRSSRENYLYYIMKKYQQTAEGRALLAEQAEHERALGVVRVPSVHSFDVEAQVIDLSRLDPQHFDPRLIDRDRNGQREDLSFLKESNALILNIDYPLGLAAFNILSKVAEQTDSIEGVYVMGKSASLNAVRGDVMIPNVVQDEHSHNTYLFENVFSAADVAPFLKYGTVLDNQKGICVLGTFLQNARVMDVFFREGYADIEMEAGPFLSAVYEMYRPKRHPVNELVNLYPVPFDLGILHYVSDTPLSKGKNLGAGTLSYFGMDSTYATTVAILRRILHKERAKALRSPRPTGLVEEPAARSRTTSP